MSGSKSFGAISQPLPDALQRLAPDPRLGPDAGERRIGGSRRDRTILAAGIDVAA